MNCNSSWAQAQFENVCLGHPRRDARLRKVAVAMAEKPGQSIPQLFEKEYDVVACYDLFDREEATVTRIQSGHRQLVRERISRPGSVTLLLEDTSTLSWSGKEPIPGLGPVGDGSENLQGFLCHSVLAVDWPGVGLDLRTRRPAVDVIGLADQYYYVRDHRCKSHRNEKKREQLERWRESAMWSESTERQQRAPGNVRWVRISDAESDVYEHLALCEEFGHGYVIRASQDRCLIDGSHLFRVARDAASLGSFALQLRGRPNEPAREAHLHLSACSVELRAPWRPRNRGHTISCSVVRVYEPDPPEGSEALEWILLTDMAVSSFEDALEAALQYSTRWLIEEFHKALKTGMGAEKLQLEEGHRLMAAIAVMSVIAVRLIHLREYARVDPDGPAERSGLSPLELQILRVKLSRPIRTVGEVALAVGRIGGHMNRKRDGMPGWLTLWRGMLALNTLVEGYQIAQQVESFDQ